MDMRERISSTWRVRMIQIFDVILRVPPLFMMDAILNLTFLHIWPWDPVHLPSFGFKLLFILFILFIGFVLALAVFCLATRQIIDVFAFLMSGCILLMSYWFSCAYVKDEIKSAEYNEDIISIALSPAFLVNLFIQVTVAFTYNLYRRDLSSGSYDQRFLSNLTVTRHRGAIYLLLLQPLLARLVTLPKNWLAIIPSLTFVVLAFDFQCFFLSKLKGVWRLLRGAYFTSRYMLNNYGLQTYVETQWTRLHVPHVLRVFWLTRMCVELIWILGAYYYTTGTITLDNLRAAGLHQLVSGCETVVALLGTTAVIACLAHHLGLALAAFLKSDGEDDRNMGTMSAILFFILALQTGLTGLDEEKRLIRLAKNLCLLATAVLHFVHSSVHPLLLNLSASGGSRRHWRPLVVCAALLLVPACLLSWLWANHSVSTWLLAVSAFSIEVMVKVVISLLVYSLFMLDASSEVFWEGLDDYVYYITATGSTVEFLFGIFLFCNGAWILVFESGGAIRAVMMCVHAYYNIWVQAQDGWKVFTQRRTAVAKINSLPLATQTELASREDEVCAICYQGLASTARVTPCQHFFHGVCLRKWLYVQDSCPLCHHLIYNRQESEESSVDGGGGVGGNRNHVLENNNRVDPPRVPPRPHHDHLHQD